MGTEAIPLRASSTSACARHAPNDALENSDGNRSVLLTYSRRLCNVRNRSHEFRTPFRFTRLSLNRITALHCPANLLYPTAELDEKLPKLAAGNHQLTTDCLWHLREHNACATASIEAIGCPPKGSRPNFAKAKGRQRDYYIPFDPAAQRLLEVIQAKPLRRCSGKVKFLGVFAESSKLSAHAKNLLRFMFHSVTGRLRGQILRRPLPARPRYALDASGAFLAAASTPDRRQESKSARRTSLPNKRASIVKRG